VDWLDSAAALFSAPEWEKLTPHASSLPRLKRLRVRIPGAPAAVVYEWELPTELLSLTGLFGLAPFRDGIASPGADGVRGYLAVQPLGTETWIARGPTLETVGAAHVALARKSGGHVREVEGVEAVLSEDSVAAGYLTPTAALDAGDWFIPQDFVEGWPRRARPLAGSGPALLTHFLQIKTGQLLETKLRLHSTPAFTEALVTLLVELSSPRQVFPAP
jgi:hypothetical protein